MFRPLLSSVPSTTFYVGKARSVHFNTSLNSSVTTSSNTSSDRGMSALPDTEGNYCCQDDIVEESGKVLCPDIQEEVFAFDEADKEEFGSELHSDVDRVNTTEGYPINSDDIEVSTSQEPAQVHDGFSEVVNLGSTMLCSLCGSNYDATDLMEMEIKLCKECRMKENFPDAITPETSTVAANEPTLMTVTAPEECEDKGSLAIVVSGSHLVAETDEINDSRTHLLDDSPSVSCVQMEEDNVANGAGEQSTCGCGPSVRGTSSQELEHSSNHLNTNVSEAEGAGISLLLERSSCTKGLVVQGRALTALSVFPDDDLSYVRETSNGMRSSIGRWSFSSSSSINMSSSREMETQMQRQFSGRKSDTENYRCEVQSRSLGSSFCGTSSCSSQSAVLVTTTSEVNLEGSVGDTNSTFNAETAAASVEQQPGLELVVAEIAYLAAAVLKEETSEHAESGRQVDASVLWLSSCNTDAGPEDDSMACDNMQEASKSENCQDLRENMSNEADIKASSAMQNDLSGSSVTILNDMSAPTDGSLVSASEVEVHDCHQCITGSEVIDISPDPDAHMDGFKETPDPISSDPIVEILGQSSIIPLFFNLKHSLWSLVL